MFFKTGEPLFEAVDPYPVTPILGGHNMKKEAPTAGAYLDRNNRNLKSERPQGTLVPYYHYFSNVERVFRGWDAIAV